MKKFRKVPRKTTYLEEIAQQVWRATEAPVPCYPEDQAVMWLGYAVLVQVKGTETTSEDVHDAWTAWSIVDAITRGKAAHKSAIPFEQLPTRVQGYDDLYRDAIRQVAKDLDELKGRGICDAENTDPVQA